jgi:TRAP-type C4-dicarboxylate transport system permease small subunit
VRLAIPVGSALALIFFAASLVRLLRGLPAVPDPDPDREPPQTQ